MATDNATSPVMCYQQGSGSFLTGIPAASGIGGEVRGVAVESDKIWVSNTATDQLYRITEISDIGNTSTPVDPSLPGIEILCNPFRSTVGFSANACGAWQVEIFDTCGRVIYAVEFTDSMIWDSGSYTAGRGLYLAIFTNSEGIRQSEKLIKY
ncbi:MAG: T9SS type A sorting domain-containing protein [Candidatus Sabulitectum sp.]|nr:T9SS type A sorting domain-containing protein [Candidatus Sabulitectum sp.]